MKKTAFLKISCAALVSAIATLVARADVDINDNVTLSGYAAASFKYEKAQTSSKSTLDLDAAKLGVFLKYAPFSGKISGFTDAGAHKIYLLDAFGTYAINQQYSVTAGRFLSYIGYTPFDVPDQAFISSSVPNVMRDPDNGISDMNFTGAPAYHDGARVDFKQGNWNAGFAVVDSLYSLPNKPYRGDGSIRDGVAFEAKARYITDKWTANLSLGYEATKQGSERDPDTNVPLRNPGAPQIYIADLWGQWTPTKDTTVGGEVFYRRDQINKDSAYSGLSQNIWFVLVQARQQVDENYAFGARFSFGGERIGNYWRVTILPLSYTVSKNMEMRFEFSYTKYSDRIRTPSNDGFVGAQAIIKF